MHLVRCEHVYDELHPRRGVGCVAAVGEARDQFAKGVERFARRTGIALADILPRQGTQHAEVVVEIDQPAQVPGIVGAGMRGIEFQEAVDRCQRLDRLGVLPLRVCEFQHCLLRVPAERVARLERLVQLDRALPVPGVHLVARFRVQLGRGPAAGLVEVADGRAAANEGDRNDRDHRLPHCHYTRPSPFARRGRAGTATCPVGIRPIGIRNCGFHRFVRSMASN